MWCCRAAIPYVIDQGSGSIVNIATHAVTGAFRAPYAAAKAGQIGLTTSLSREVAHLGVRVNCVAPSGTLADDRVTPRDHGVDVPALPQEEMDYQEKYRVETRLVEIPMGRRGETWEQAAAIAFLASDDAAYITGQVLPRRRRPTLLLLSNCSRLRGWKRFAMGIPCLVAPSP